MAVQVREKIRLQNYMFMVMETISAKPERFEENDKVQIEQAVQDKINWLDRAHDHNPTAYVGQLEELELVVNPIMMKVYTLVNGRPHIHHRLNQSTWKSSTARGSRMPDTPS